VPTAVESKQRASRIFRLQTSLYPFIADSGQFYVNSCLYPFRTILSPALVLKTVIFKTDVILRQIQHFILSYTFVLQVTIVTIMIAKGLQI
jgi:hypothetical protein